VFARSLAHACAWTSDPEEAVLDSQRSQPHWPLPMVRGNFLKWHWIRRLRLRLRPTGNQHNHDYERVRVLARLLSALSRLPSDSGVMLLVDRHDVKPTNRCCSSQSDLRLAKCEVNNERSRALAVDSDPTPLTTPHVPILLPSFLPVPCMTTSNICRHSLRAGS
jgi:hypothetical protein